MVGSTSGLEEPNEVAKAVVGTLSWLDVMIIGFATSIEAELDQLQLAADSIPDMSELDASRIVDEALVIIRLRLANVGSRRLCVGVEVRVP